MENKATADKIFRKVVVAYNLKLYTHVTCSAKGGNARAEPYNRAKNFNILETFRLPLSITIKEKKLTEHKAIRKLCCLK